MFRFVGGALAGAQWMGRMIPQERRMPRRCDSGMLRLKTRGGFFVPSQSKIKDFCQLSHRESQGRCRARGRHWARRKAERWRTLSERPYIHDGKCCDFAGRQWECAMFYRAGGGTPPLREDGRLGGFAGGWCGQGRFCCTPHQSPSVTAFT